jgi:hypothetical protein
MARPRVAKSVSAEWRGSKSNEAVGTFSPDERQLTFVSSWSAIFSLLNNDLERMP